MKTTLVLVVMSLGLSLGCSAGEVGREGEPLPEESAAEDVGQAEQEINTPCFQHCQCPLTERCNSSNYCESYAVWGPDTSPLSSDRRCFSRAGVSAGARLR
ncbi:uncharacterized protein SOCE26_090480 [Sorangium cellulosum]|uniref:Secreted protein n=1 Tax=Sorangium cellulosum TaxID=56 RepID=A0A2L0F7N3_SORCE|nr:uncharacterized protein SOCE26_090480 [Sorangium cellulosum]